jgi:hypothetical protein
MSKITCKICGATSDEKSLYHESFSKHLDGYHCWTCYQKQAVELKAKGFGCGTVGENSGWIIDATFAEAIEFALSEIEFEDNIDMGIRISSAIDTGYYSSAIVRNHQLYVKVAELHHLQDMEQAERIAYIENILSQLTFELKNKK